MLERPIVVCVVAAAVSEASTAVEMGSTEPTVDTGASLHTAASNGDKACVRVSLEGALRCLELGVCSCECVHARDESCGGLTALMVAAKAGHADVVLALLEGAKPNVNARDRIDGLTAFAMAAAQGHEAVVAALAADPSIAVNCKSFEGKTPLMLAVEGGHAAVVKKLLALPAVDVTAQIATTRLDALHLAAQNGKWDIVRMLVATGRFDVNNMLMWGVRNNSYPAVCMMASLGADVNKLAGGQLGTSPLALAAAAGHSSIMSLLVARGAEIQEPFVWAARAGHLGAVQALVVEGADVDGHCGVDNTDVALTAAARAGHKDVVKYLLSTGADPEKLTRLYNDYKTLLVLMACEGKADIAALLIEHGAEVDARDATRQTPLMFAASHGKPEVASLLLSHGADVNARCTDNMTALAWARSKQFAEVEQILLSVGATV